MSSLADLPTLIGFFSYSRGDDVDSGGKLSKLRAKIDRELATQLGRDHDDQDLGPGRERNFRLWQDRAAIQYGAEWESKIDEGIAQSVFFIPIVTPRAIKSPKCKFEFDSFRRREALLGRRDLIFPVLYVRAPELEKEDFWRGDEILETIATRQYPKWMRFRQRDPEDWEFAEEIETFCANIVDALRLPWTQPALEPAPMLVSEPDPIPERNRAPDAIEAALVDKAAASPPRARRTRAAKPKPPEPKPPEPEPPEPETPPATAKAVILDPPEAPAPPTQSALVEKIVADPVAPKPAPKPAPLAAPMPAPMPAPAPNAAAVAAKPPPGPAKTKRELGPWIAGAVVLAVVGAILYWVGWQLLLEIVGGLILIGVVVGLTEEYPTLRGLLIFVWFVLPFMLYFGVQIWDGATGEKHDVCSWPLVGGLIRSRFSSACAQTADPTVGLAPYVYKPLNPGRFDPLAPLGGK